MKLPENKSINKYIDCIDIQLSNIALMNDIINRELRLKDLIPLNTNMFYYIYRLGKYTKPVPIKDFMNQSMIFPRNLTFMNKKLEKEGYIRRDSHKTDRRLRLISLTDKGKHIFNIISSIMDTMITSIHPDDEEIKSLHHELVLSLNKLRNHYQDN